jgi:cation:H+ antiporter
VVLLVWYGAYVAFLVMDATDHQALEGLESALVWFVLPSTALTFVVAMARGVLARRREASID